MSPADYHGTPLAFHIPESTLQTVPSHWHGLCTANTFANNNNTSLWIWKGVSADPPFHIQGNDSDKPVPTWTPLLLVVSESLHKPLRYKIIINGTFRPFRHLGLKGSYLPRLYTTLWRQGDAPQITQSRQSHNIYLYTILHCRNPDRARGITARLVHPTSHLVSIIYVHDL